MDAVALARGVELVESWPGMAQLCVLRHGETVLDLSVRCEPDTLFLLWSTGKPLTAVAVHLLAERGLLDLDEPVCRYWPQYARGGKEKVTVRHVLQHMSGAPLSTGSIIGDALAMPSWRLSVRAAEHARQKSPAGTVSTYHVLSYGFILGELVRRVDGRPIGEFCRTELFEPAGLHDTYVGLPNNLWPRRAPLESPPKTRPHNVSDDQLKMAMFMFDRKPVRTAVVPAANVHATARDIAKFYQLLLDDGEADGGVRVFDPKTVAEARRPAVSDREPASDPIIGHPVRWAQGFQLGWGGSSVTTAQPFGITAGREVFGHNGSNYCNAWADPDNGLVFVYLTNLVAPREEALRHQTELSDAIRAAAGDLV
jgi:CubicO group peptidase (beta-lactamase class C family)